MIKVNLKNTKTSISRFGYSEPGTEGGVTEETRLSTVLTQLKQMDLSGLETDFLLKVLLKTVFLLTLPFALKVYEVINITRLENIRKKAEANLTETKAKVNQLQSRIDSYGYLKKKEEEFNKKKALLSDLATSRLVIPRFLDEIQTSIPPSVWLKKVQVDSKQKEKRTVSFSGESLNEEIVNIFVEELKGIVNANSIQLNTQDVKEGDIPVKVRFDIKAEMHD